MTRLIVEDGGRRRAFRVREGKLTIGSGEACTLRLTAPDVAEVHAELELAGGRVTLTPRPGVVPPSIAGQALQGPTFLPDGARVAIGSAELEVRYGGEAAGPGGTPARPRPAAKAATGSGPGAHAVRSRAASTPAAPPAQPVARGPRPPRVQSTRPLHEVKKGVPVPLVLLGLAVALIVLVALGSKYWSKGAVGFDPASRYRDALKYHSTGDHARAELELKKLDLATLSPDLRLKVEELQAELGKVDGERALHQHDELGSEYMDTQLVRFEDERLQGSPPREAVRVFLKRCKYFRETWPDHPDRDWIERRESRFRGYVNLSDPPTYKDVEFEVKTMTWAMPRDYRTAFRLLEDFVEHGPGNERDLALALSKKLVEEREAYFLDRMQQAAWCWERDQQGAAVEWLAQLVMKVGDDTMEAEAARELLLLPGIEEWLRGYRRDRPEQFGLLIEEPAIRDFAREHDL